MLASFLVSRLNAALSSVFHTIERDQLSISLLAGELCLENLRFKEDSLLPFSFPVQVTYGCVRFVRLKVNFLRLLSRPVTIEAKDILGILTTLPASEWSVEVEEENWRNSKQLLLLSDEWLTFLREGDTGEGSSFLARLLAALIKRTELFATRVELRLEEAEIRHDGCFFAVGWRAERIHTLLCEEETDLSTFSNGIPSHAPVKPSTACSVCSSPANLTTRETVVPSSRSSPSPRARSSPEASTAEPSSAEAVPPSLESVEYSVSPCFDSATGRQTRRTNEVIRDNDVPRSVRAGDATDGGPTQNGEGPAQPLHDSLPDGTHAQARARARCRDSAPSRAPAVPNVPGETGSGDADPPYSSCGSIWRRLGAALLPGRPANSPLPSAASSLSSSASASGSPSLHRASDGGRDPCLARLPPRPCFLPQSENASPPRLRGSDTRQYDGQYADFAEACVEPPRAPPWLHSRSPPSSSVHSMNSQKLCDSASSHCPQCFAESPSGNRSVTSARAETVPDGADVRNHRTASRLCLLSSSQAYFKKIEFVHSAIYLDQLTSSGPLSPWLPHPAAYRRHLFSQGVSSATREPRRTSLPLGSPHPFPIPSTGLTPRIRGDSERLETGSEDGPREATFTPCDIEAPHAGDGITSPAPRPPLPSPRPRRRPADVTGQALSELDGDEGGGRQTHRMEERARLPVGIELTASDASHGSPFDSTEIRRLSAPAPRMRRRGRRSDQRPRRGEKPSPLDEAGRRHDDQDLAVSPSSAASSTVRSAVGRDPGDVTSLYDLVSLDDMFCKSEESAPHHAYIFRPGRIELYLRLVLTPKQGVHSCPLLSDRSFPRPLRPSVGPRSPKALLSSAAPAGCSPSFSPCGWNLSSSAIPLLDRLQRTTAWFTDSTRRNTDNDDVPYRDPGRHTRGEGRPRTGAAAQAWGDQDQQDVVRVQRGDSLCPSFSQKEDSVCFASLEKALFASQSPDAERILAEGGSPFASTAVKEPPYLPPCGMLRLPARAGGSEHRRGGREQTRPSRDTGVFTWPQSPRVSSSSPRDRVRPGRRFSEHVHAADSEAMSSSLPKLRRAASLRQDGDNALRVRHASSVACTAWENGWSSADSLRNSRQGAVRGSRTLHNADDGVSSPPAGAGSASERQGQTRDSETDGRDRGEDLFAPVLLSQGHSVYAEEEDNSLPSLSLTFVVPSCTLTLRRDQVTSIFQWIQYTIVLYSDLVYGAVADHMKRKPSVEEQDAYTAAWRRHLLTKSGGLPTVYSTCRAEPAEARRQQPNPVIADSPLSPPAVLASSAESSTAASCPSWSLLTEEASRAEAARRDEQTLKNFEEKFWVDEIIPLRHLALASLKKASERQRHRLEGGWGALAFTTLKRDEGFLSFVDSAQLSLSRSDCDTRMRNERVRRASSREGALPFPSVSSVPEGSPSATVERREERRQEESVPRPLFAQDGAATVLAGADDSRRRHLCDSLRRGGGREGAFSASEHEGQMHKAHRGCQREADGSRDVGNTSSDVMPDCLLVPRTFARGRVPNCRAEEALCLHTDAPGGDRVSERHGGRQIVVTGSDGRELIFERTMYTTEILHGGQTHYVSNGYHRHSSLFSSAPLSTPFASPPSSCLPGCPPPTKERTDSQSDANCQSAPSTFLRASFTPRPACDARRSAHTSSLNHIGHHSESPYVSRSCQVNAPSPARDASPAHVVADNGVATSGFAFIGADLNPLDLAEEEWDESAVREDVLRNIESLQSGRFTKSTLVAFVFKDVRLRLWSSSSSSPHSDAGARGSRRARGTTTAGSRSAFLNGQRTQPDAGDGDQMPPPPTLASRRRREGAASEEERRRTGERTAWNAVWGAAVRERTTFHRQRGEAEDTRRRQTLSGDDHCLLLTCDELYFHRLNWADGRGSSALFCERISVVDRFSSSLPCQVVRSYAPPSRPGECTATCGNGWSLSANRVPPAACQSSLSSIRVPHYTAQPEAWTPPHLSSACGDSSSSSCSAPLSPAGACSSAASLAHRNRSVPSPRCAARTSSSSALSSCELLRGPSSFFSASCSYSPRPAQARWKLPRGSPATDGAIVGGSRSGRAPAACEGSIDSEDWRTPALGQGETSSATKSLSGSSTGQQLQSRATATSDADQPRLQSAAQTGRCSLRGVVGPGSAAAAVDGLWRHPTGDTHACGVRYSAATHSSTAFEESHAPLPHPGSSGSSPLQSCGCLGDGQQLGAPQPFGSPCRCRNVSRTTPPRQYAWIRVEQVSRRLPTHPDLVVYGEMCGPVTITVSPLAVSSAISAVTQALEPVERAYVLSRAKGRVQEAIRKSEIFMAELADQLYRADVCITLKSPLRLLVPLCAQKEAAQKQLSPTHRRGRREESTLEADGPIDGISVCDPNVSPRQELRDAHSNANARAISPASLWPYSPPRGGGRRDRRRIGAAAASLGVDAAGESDPQEAVVRGWKGATADTVDTRKWARRRKSQRESGSVRHQPATGADSPPSSLPGARKQRENARNREVGANELYDALLFDFGVIVIDSQIRVPQCDLVHDEGGMLLLRAAAPGTEPLVPSRSLLRPSPHARPIRPPARASSHHVPGSSADSTKTVQKFSVSFCRSPSSLASPSVTPPPQEAARNIPPANHSPPLSSKDGSRKQEGTGPPHVSSSASALPSSSPSWSKDFSPCSSYRLPPPSSPSLRASICPPYDRYAVLCSGWSTSRVHSFLAFMEQTAECACAVCCFHASHKCFCVRSRNESSCTPPRRRVAENRDDAAGAWRPDDTHFTFLSGAGGHACPGLRGWCRSQVGGGTGERESEDDVAQERRRTPLASPSPCRYFYATPAREVKAPARSPGMAQDPGYRIREERAYRGNGNKAGDAKSSRPESRYPKKTEDDTDAGNREDTGQDRARDSRSGTYILHPLSFRMCGDICHLGGDAVDSLRLPKFRLLVQDDSASGVFVELADDDVRQLSKLYRECLQALQLSSCASTHTRTDVPAAHAQGTATPLRYGGSRRCLAVVDGNVRPVYTSKLQTRDTDARLGLFPLEHTRGHRPACHWSKSHAISRSCSAPHEGGSTWSDSAAPAKANMDREAVAPLFLTLKSDAALEDRRGNRRPILPSFHKLPRLSSASPLPPRAAGEESDSSRLSLQSQSSSASSLDSHPHRGERCAPPVVHSCRATYSSPTLEDETPPQRPQGRQQSRRRSLSGRNQHEPHYLQSMLKPLLKTGQRRRCSSGDLLTKDSWRDWERVGTPYQEDQGRPAMHVAPACDACLSDRRFPPLVDTRGRENSSFFQMLSLMVHRAFIRRRHDEGDVSVSPPVTLSHVGSSLSRRPETPEQRRISRLTRMFSLLSDRPGVRNSRLFKTLHSSSLSDDRSSVLRSSTEGSRLLGGEAADRPSPRPNDEADSACLPRFSVFTGTHRPERRHGGTLRFLESVSARQEGLSGGRYRGMDSASQSGAVRTLSAGPPGSEAMHKQREPDRRGGQKREDMRHLGEEAADYRLNRHTRASQYESSRDADMGYSVSDRESHMLEAAGLEGVVPARNLPRQVASAADGRAATPLPSRTTPVFEEVADSEGKAEFWVSSPRQKRLRTTSDAERLVKMERTVTRRSSRAKALTVSGGGTDADEDTSAEGERRVLRGRCPLEKLLQYREEGGSRTGEKDRQWNVHFFRGQSDDDFWQNRQRHKRRRRTRRTRSEGDNDKLSLEPAPQRASLGAYREGPPFSPSAMGDAFRRVVAKDGPVGKPASDQNRGHCSSPPGVCTDSASSSPRGLVSAEVQFELSRLTIVVLWNAEGCRSVARRHFSATPGEARSASSKSQVKHERAKEDDGDTQQQQTTPTAEDDRCSRKRRAPGNACVALDYNGLRQVSTANVLKRSDLLSRLPRALEQDNCHTSPRRVACQALVEDRDGACWSGRGGTEYDLSGRSTSYGVDSEADADEARARARFSASAASGEGVPLFRQCHDGLASSVESPGRCASLGADAHSSTDPSTHCETDSPAGTDTSRSCSLHPRCCACCRDVAAGHERQKGHGLSLFPGTGRQLCVGISIVNVRAAARSGLSSSRDARVIDVASLGEGAVVGSTRCVYRCSAGTVSLIVPQSPDSPRRPGLLHVCRTAVAQHPERESRTRREGTKAADAGEGARAPSSAIREGTGAVSGGDRSSQMWSPASAVVHRGAKAESTADTSSEHDREQQRWSRYQYDEANVTQGHLPEAGQTNPDCGLSEGVTAHAAPGSLIQSICSKRRRRSSSSQSWVACKQETSSEHDRRGRCVQNDVRPLRTDITAQEQTRVAPTANDSGLCAARPACHTRSQGRKECRDTMERDWRDEPSEPWWWRCHTVFMLHAIRREDKVDPSLSLLPAPPPALVSLCERLAPFLPPRSLQGEQENRVPASDNTNSDAGLSTFSSTSKLPEEQGEWTPRRSSSRARLGFAQVPQGVAGGGQPSRQGDATMWTGCEMAEVRRRNDALNGDTVERYLVASETAKRASFLAATSVPLFPASTCRPACGGGSTSSRTVSSRGRDNSALFPNLASGCGLHWRRAFPPLVPCFPGQYVLRRELHPFSRLEISRQATAGPAAHTVWIASPCREMAEREDGDNKILVVEEEEGEEWNTTEVVIVNTVLGLRWVVTSREAALLAHETRRRGTQYLSLLADEGGRRSSVLRQQPASRNIDHERPLASREPDPTRLAVIGDASSNRLRPRFSSAPPGRPAMIMEPNGERYKAHGEQDKPDLQLDGDICFKSLQHSLSLVIQPYRILMDWEAAGNMVGKSEKKTGRKKKTGKRIEHKAEAHKRWGTL
ncbi:hypothetical protein BESB_074610 [Besnoitia besnoiti]|uniref:Uncharacterized protein n=1 Tax=Besnoitia besnoiti TaxID=94643 RepID=A0A2A9M8S4_BESBE|nr:uncharacterized protein BESB_074610 [Besnoitia besnoiti]PFH34309.1 hypothetical protein BESB_074610 [Besnoitia besnoiti]